ncbi:MAG: hypothetical protein LBP56_10880 [Odoribacteraceae bacterium]|jgi:hypothetical protein|nr:hypothetical protein [Odoribacteraceae bacterium]
MNIYLYEIQQVENTEFCGKPFEAKTVITRFCSKECGHKADSARKKAGREEVRKLD